MSELTERRWALVSERGLEADDLSYDEAVALEHELLRENLHGLCIVTNQAARRSTEKKSGVWSRESGVKS